MIEPGTFDVDPWSLTEPELHLDLLAETESLFALSNGHIGLRGNLDEGEPHDIPGSYLNGFFEDVPLPYAEAGYGYPEQGQSLIDVTNGKLMRLLVDDEPFDVRQGTIVEHRRTLDLRDGVLRRDVTWTSPAGRTVRVRSTRLVSFAQRAIVAVDYRVEPLDGPARIVVQSTLVANEPSPERRDDPRAAAALRSPLVGEYHTHHDLEAALGHRTRSSGLRMAAGLEHVVDGPADTLIESESEADLARVTISTQLGPGEQLRVVKFLAYGWSSRRSMPALRDQVDAALAAAKHTGWDGLVRSQREYLDDIWRRADVELDGQPELQQAVRFALFQVIQSSARAEQRAIPAKGLTGRGYDGHTFWDSETYTLPVLSHVLPHAAGDALRWRHSTLDLARDRAKELRLRGAAFPWRTIRGEECSGYWPAGTAAFHINADIADAVRRYVTLTGDEDFDRGPGLELLVETARLWASLGHFDATGCFRIDGVTGPDEYTAVIDNNTFTNLMAARNLREAAAAVQRHGERADELGVSAEEVDTWRKAAEAMLIPYDDELGVTAQSENFTRYREWDFAATTSEDYPLLMHFPYYVLYSSQVVKQADLVFALYLCGEGFSAEQKRRDFEYYEPITVRDSTLSAPIQSIVAAEVGHLGLAFEYLCETALVDLHDSAGNVADGIHLAAAAGTWLAVVAGFGGMRDHRESLCFEPRLPDELDRIAFGMVHRGNQLRVEVTRERTRYELVQGAEMELWHHGELVRLTASSPVELAMPTESRPAPVRPPAGREAGSPGVGANGRDHAAHPRVN